MKEADMLSNTPKIIFVGFDDKPIDMAQSLQKRIKEKSVNEIALENYFKSLYNLGEAKQ